MFIFSSVLQYSHIYVICFENYKESGTSTAFIDCTPHDIKSKTSICDSIHRITNLKWCLVGYVARQDIDCWTFKVIPWRRTKSKQRLKNSQKRWLDDIRKAIRKQWFCWTQNKEIEEIKGGYDWEETAGCIKKVTIVWVRVMIVTSYLQKAWKSTFYIIHINQCFPKCGTRTSRGTGKVLWGYTLHQSLVRITIKIKWILLSPN